VNWPVGAGGKGNDVAFRGPPAQPRSATSRYAYVKYKMTFAQLQQLRRHYVNAPDQLQSCRRC
jgi:hypothetical protein